VELDAKGRAVGVVYFDADKKEQLQRAKAVILSANGAETAKLLLMSADKGFRTASPTRAATSAST